MLLEMAEFAVARHAAVLGVEFYDLGDDVFAIRAVEFRKSLGFYFSGFYDYAVKIENDRLPVKIFHVYARLSEVAGVASPRMPSRLTNKVFKIRMVPQKGIMISKPVRK